MAQQDGVPDHKAKATIALIKSWGITLVSWPAVSPDLSPKPGGRSYAVGLLNVPEGFVVKSISSDDDGDLLHGKRLNVADSHRRL